MCVLFVVIDFSKKSGWVVMKAAMLRKVNMCAALWIFEYRKDFFNHTFAFHNYRDVMYFLFLQSKCEPMARRRNESEHRESAIQTLRTTLTKYRMQVLHCNF